MNAAQYKIHTIGVALQRDGTIPDALKTPFDDKLVELITEAGRPLSQIQRKLPRLHESGLIKRAMRIYDEAKGGSHGSATDS